MIGRGHGPINAFNNRSRGVRKMSAKTTNSVEWDGQALKGWITVDGVLTKVMVDRETIHRYAAGFNDAVTWEIDRHRELIFEKLTPFLTGHAKSCAA
jgi:hypothetical protein